VKKSWVSALVLGTLASSAGAQTLSSYTVTSPISSTLTTTSFSSTSAASVLASYYTTNLSTSVISPTSTISSTSLISATSLVSYPWLIYFLQPTAKCLKWDLTRCTNADLGNPWYRQIVIMPSGYTEDERADFWTDFDTIVTQMSNAGTVWSTTKRDKILYVGYFTGGGPLGAPDAAFGGAVLAHPIRDFALTLSLEAVKAKINEIKSTTYSNLRPMGVQVILNDFSTNVTANAAPPSFMGGGYGIAKMNRDDLRSAYIATHELGHAALNFVDEYVEGGFENLNIRSIDVATPLVLFDGTWSGFVRAIDDLFGIYDYNMSEILAGNGNHNVALSSRPSTVHSPISAPQAYDYEGGMFFGRGTWHAAGRNLMNSDGFNPGPQNGFAYTHSGAQQQLINTAFGDAPYRANDRLRNSGPRNGWWGELGGTTIVMMYDGDKRNHFQRSTQYAVQVGWWERVWYTEWWGFVPIPRYRDEWRTAQKTVYPTERRIELRASALYGLANMTQSLLCGVGVTEVPKPDGGVFKLCETPLDSVASAFLPTFTFRTPYEETSVPASQWFTTYWWRFASYNGHVWSGWTGYSSFYRSL
jgi:hypothetical protein